MAKIFLLALLSLSAFFFTLHADANGSPCNPDPSSSSWSRSLLQYSEPERRIANPPSAERESMAEAPVAEWENRRVGKHHSSDKSVAGGGVIIGGLVTAIFASVYCYIRVTRRNHEDALR